MIIWIFPIAIILTIVLSIVYASLKRDFDIQNNEKLEKIETNPKFILNQIKNRLNTIIVILIIPTIIQIFMILTFLNKIDSITKPIQIIK